MHERSPAVMKTGEPPRFSLRILFVAVTFVAVFLFMVVWLANNFSVGIIVPGIEPKSFDQKKWKAWSIKDMEQSDDIRRAFARRDMLDDLLARHSFTGWTEAELTSLLGPSNPEFCPNDWDVAYLLGMDWADYVVLVFRVDNSGKVKTYHVVMF